MSDFHDCLASYSKPVQASVKRLMTDPRSITIRPLLSESLLLQIAGELEHAMVRNVWTQTTQRERDEWRAKFEKISSELLDLMRKGPRPPETWGFPVQRHTLFRIIARLGYSVPEPAEYSNPEYHKKLIEIEEAAEMEGWTLADSIEHYQMNTLQDASVPQPLKKPGDAKAERSAFIYWMKSHGKLSAKDLAIIASIVFEDEAIDERLVRRITSTRADSSES